MWHKTYSLKRNKWLFGDETENSMHDNTEVCDEHETTHVEPESAIDNEARTMNHVHTQPHSQHVEIKWKRITRPHVNEEIRNTDGKNNKDGLGITVGSKRGHANYSVDCT